MPREDAPRILPPNINQIYHYLALKRSDSTELVIQSCGNPGMSRRSPVSLSYLIYLLLTGRNLFVAAAAAVIIRKSTLAAPAGFILFPSVLQ